MALQLCFPIWRLAGSLSSRAPSNYQNRDAYVQALAAQIQALLLLDEAQRRGIQVQDQQVDDYLATEQAMLAADTAASDELAAYRGALNLDDSSWLTGNLSLNARSPCCFQEIYGEAPTVSDADVQQYLVDNPTPSVMQLLVVTYEAPQHRQRLSWRTLSSLLTCLKVIELLRSLRPYSQTLINHLDVSRMRQEFRYVDAETLPDFPRRMPWKQPDGYAGIVYNDDGTAVLYMRLAGDIARGG